MTCRQDRKKLETQLADKRNRLELYKAQEIKMLTGGVQSYSLGTRSVSRYTTELANVQNAIKQLETEIAELDALLCGGSRRRAVGAVPRDDW